MSEKDEVEIKIVLPPCSDDEVSEGLRRLTRAIHESGKADGERGGLLGGEWGYGANFENETFMIHRYCWCEEETCPWCAGDAGPFGSHGMHAYYDTGNTTAPNFLHKASGSKVWWYKYIGRGMEMDIKMPWPAILTDCLASLGGSSV